MVNGQSALFDLSDAAVAPRPKPEEDEAGIRLFLVSGIFRTLRAPEEESEPPASSEAADLDSPKTGDMGLVPLPLLVDRCGSRCCFVQEEINHLIVKRMEQHEKIS